MITFNHKYEIEKIYKHYLKVLKDKYWDIDIEATKSFEKLSLSSDEYWIYSVSEIEYSC